MMRYRNDDPPDEDYVIMCPFCFANIEDKDEEALYEGADGYWYCGEAHYQLMQIVHLPLEWMERQPIGPYDDPTEVSPQMCLVLETIANMMSLCCHGWGDGGYWLHPKSGGDGKIVFDNRGMVFTACYSGEQGAWDTHEVGALTYDAFLNDSIDDSAWAWEIVWSLLDAAHAACTTDEEDNHAQV